MMDFLKASEAEKRLIPGKRFDGPTGWLIAIMSFVMVLVASAALALGGAAHSLGRSADGDFTVELAGGADKAEAMVAALRDVDGVTKVEVVPERELRRALEQWLGPDVARDSAGLPLPLLVDVSVAGNSSADRIAEAAFAVAPAAQVVRHADRMRPVLDGLSALVGVAVLLVLLVAGGTATAVVLATRGALDTHRATLSVMHGIGATDEQIARLFQRKIALDALAGGAAGTLAALALLIGLAFVLGGSLTMLAGAPLIAIPELLLLLLLPIGLAVLATGVARRTVLSTLREQP